MSTPACGTYAGWNRHRKQNTPVCELCRAAQASYVKDLRRRTKGVGMYHFPVVLPLRFMDMALLGSVLAESFRGAA